MIVNRYPGKCQSCGIKLAAGEGFAYRNGHRWFSVCPSTACHNRLGVKAPVPESQIAKVLDDEGFITMPYDRAAIPLLRSMPGARWNPEKKQWKVSIEPKDLLETGPMRITITTQAWSDERSSWVKHEETFETYSKDHWLEVLSNKGVRLEQR